MKLRLWTFLLILSLSLQSAFAGRSSDEVSSDKFNDHLMSTEYFSQGKRKLSIIATSEGYYPEKMAVFVGEEITIFFTSTQKTAHCLTIPEKKVFLSGIRGSITESVVTFEQPGKYIFYCPAMSHRGEITVLPRSEEDEQGKGRRSIASMDDENNNEYDGPWIPRDE